MFGLQQPDDNKGLAANQMTENKEVIGQDDGVKGQMYTMPSTVAHPKHSGGKKKSPILIIGVILILGIVIAAAIYVFSTNMFLPADDLSVDNDLLVNSPLTDKIPDDIKPDQEAAPVDDSSPVERDEQRLQDISSIRSALALYYQVKKAYPDILVDLIDDYLESIPVNPNPGGVAYSYLPQDSNQSYKLTFTLESGGQMGPLNFTAGDYQADPMVINPFLEPSEEEVGEAINEGEGADLIIGLDSDNDGLTDIEENLYQTDSTLVDSDADGYSDASELVNLYDPSQADSMLIDSNLVTKYINTAFNYSMLYPTEWTVRALTEDKKEIIFNSTTTEFVQVIILANALALSAKNWYLQYNANANPDDLREIILSNTVGIQTTDKRYTYLGIGSNIYAIIYNIGTSNQLNYSATYDMMLNSWELITVPEESAGDRDQQRLGDVTSIRLALLQYQVANLSLPTEIDNDVDSYQIIGISSEDCSATCGDMTVAASCIDLSQYLIPDYLITMPYDPLSGSDENGGYYVNLLTDGTLVLGSCHAEQSVIEVNN